MSEEAMRVRLGVAANHTRAALRFAFEAGDRRCCDLITTALESMEEALDPREQLIETMEAEPNA